MSSFKEEMKKNKKIVMGVVAATAFLAGVAAVSGMREFHEPNASVTDKAETEGSSFRTARKGSGTVVKDENRKQRLIGAVDSIEGTTNPVLATAVGDKMACELIYEPLARLKKDGTIEYVLADSAVWNQETSTLTIKLKEGILFSDGTPLTAADVCASIGMHCIAQYNMDDSSPYYYIQGVWDMNEQRAQGIQGIRKADDSTVEVTFMEARNRDWEVLETPVQKNTFALITDTFEGINPAADFIGGGVGTGPYMSESFSQGMTAVLAANPHYRTPVADIKQVELSQTNLYDMTDALNEHKVDFINYTASSEQFDTLYSAEQYNVYYRPTDNIYAIGFNTNNIFLREPKVRQAIACALDKEAALDGEWAIRFEPTDTIGYGEEDTEGLETKAQTFNKGKAKEILQSSGIQGPITLTFPVEKDNSFQMALAKQFKADLEEVGFQVYVKECTDEEYLDALYRDETFDIYLYNSTMNYDVSTFTSMTNPRGGMPVSYSGNEYLELLDSLDSAMDREAYKAALTQISDYFYENAYIVPVGRVKRYSTISSDLSGYKADPSANMLRGVNEITSDAKTGQ